MSLGLTILLARQLGAARYGYWVTLTALGGLLAPWIGLGTEKIAIRAGAGHPRGRRRWWGGAVLLRLPLGILAAAALVVFARVILGFRGELLTTALLVGAIFLLNGLGEAGAVAYRLEERMGYEALVNTAKDLALFCLVCLVLAAGGGLLGVAWAYLGAATFFVGLTVLVLRQRFFFPSWRVNPRFLFFLVKRGAPVAAAVFCNNFLDVSRILVEILRGNRAAGRFGVAGLPFRGAELVAVSAAAAFFPLLSRRQKHLDRGRPQLRLATLILAAIGLAWALPACSVPRLLIEFAFSPDYAPAAPVLAILAAGSVLLAINHIQYGALVAGGREKVFALIMAAAAAANILITLVLTRASGIVGAGIAAAALQLMLAVTLAGVIRRLYDGWPISPRTGGLLLGFLVGVGGTRLLTWSGIPWGAALAGGYLLYLPAAGKLLRDERKNVVG